MSFSLQQRRRWLALIPLALGTALLSIGANPARAALLASEPFSEATGALNNANGGTGWGGAWTTQNGDVTVPGYNVSAGTLSYSTLTASGNHGIGGNAYLSEGRGLDIGAAGAFSNYLSGGLIGLSGKTLWMSVLLRKDSSTDQENSVNLHAGGTVTWANPALISVGYFGVPSNNGTTREWSLKVAGTVTQTTVPVVVGTTALLVARIDFAATNTVTLYVNPASLGGSAPGTASATATTASSLAFRSLMYYAGDGVNQSSIDEIRFGDTYADVTPIPAPAAPTGLTATPGNAQAALSWTASTGATTYNVLRSTVSGSGYASVATGIAATSYTNTGLTNGTTYYFVVSATNSGGTSGNSSQASATPAAPAETPYGGTAWAIPGTIQAENYDNGGEGVAYHDTDTTNNGGQYRTTEGVDLEVTTDTGGGYNIGWIAAGEYVKYTVNVASTGNYDISFRVAAASATGTFHLEDTNGTNLTGSLTAPVTGGWQTWTTVTKTAVNLTAGTHVLRLFMDTANYNVNYITFAASGGSAPAAPTNLTATAGNTQVILNWTASTGATSYNALRSTVSGSGYASLATGIATTSYTNTGLTNGTTYYYVVTATSAGGTSGNSNQAGATPSATPPFNGANIAFTSTAPVIDGTIDAVWSSATQYNIANLTVGSTTATGTFKMLWDSTNLYVLADITDGTLIANTSVWNGDSVELYIDGDNSKSSGYDSNDFQFAFPWSGTVITESKHGATTGVVFAQVNRTGGYRMEMKLPLTTLGITPVAYNQIGTDVQFNDATVLGSRAGKRAWWATADNAWQSPVYFGAGQLLPGTGALPAVPSGLTATAGSYQVALSWSAASGAVDYNVKRSAVSGGPYTVVAHPTSTSYTDTGLTGGTTYYYVVSASNANGESGNSSQASATAIATIPVAPTSLGARPGNTQAALSWVATQGATTYNVKRATVNGGPYANVATGVSVIGYINTGLANGTTYYYVVTGVNAAGESVASNQASVTPAAPTVSTVNAMGINLEGIADWSTAQAFVDLVKQGRHFGSTGAPWDEAATIDSNGWPTTDAGIVLMSGYAAGVNASPYKLSFTGQAATISGVASGLTVSPPVYNSGTNTTTADVTMTSGDQMMLAFTGTKRLPTDSPGTGITNLKILRPGYTTQTFTTGIESEAAKFSVIRFMDWAATNSIQVANWSDRTTTSYGPYASRTFGSYWKDANNNPQPQAAGIPWESMIQFANETGKDMWINVPLHATDDYVTQLATLLKNTLGSSQKIYVEYDNEVWNNAYGFSQGIENPLAAQIEVNGGGSNLAYDGLIDYNINGYRLTARRTKQISDIFRSVFGDAAMMTRVRPILEGQLGYTEPLKQGMLFLENVYGNPGDYIYGCGGSAYYGPDGTPNITVDQVFSTMPGAGWAPAILADVQWAQAYGIKRIAYEGGASLDGSNLTSAVQTSAINDPRMKQAVIDEHNLWSSQGGDLLTYFTSSGGPNWGFTQDINNLASQKLQGIDALNGAARAAITVGTPATGSLVLSAGQFSLQPGFGTPATAPITLSAGGWSNYLIRVTTAASYAFKVNAGSTNGNGTLLIQVDSNTLGPVAIPNTGSTSTYADTASLSTTLPVGIHSVRIKALTDSFSVNQVKVN